jgi:hypothetical protein
MRSARQKIAQKGHQKALPAALTTGWCWTFGIFGLIVLALSFSASAQQPTFVTFDVPGAVETTPSGINPGGAIAGGYLDASFLGHGFVRASDGTFTTFDPPGAVGTVPVGIDPGGVIAGSYIDASFLDHGFLRDKHGTFTTFDVPDALTGTTTVYAINSSGTTMGVWFDSNFVEHGFLRARSGAFTTFDFPVVTCANPVGINAAGAVTGYYFSDADCSIAHGFVRDPDGTLTTFDAPNACQTINGTYAYGIEPAGVIVGDIPTLIASTATVFSGPPMALSRPSMFQGPRTQVPSRLTPPGRSRATTLLAAGISASCDLPRARSRRTLHPDQLLRGLLL